MPIPLERNLWYLMRDMLVASVLLLGHQTRYLDTDGLLISFRVTNPLILTR